MARFSSLQLEFQWSTLRLIILSFLMSACCAEAEQGNIAYTCCSQRGAFRDKGACDSCLQVQFSSEFDYGSATHPVQWTVPKQLSKNDSEFTLRLETRNDSAAYCTVRYWISGKYGPFIKSMNLKPSPKLKDVETTAVDTENSLLLRPSFFTNGSMEYKNVVYTSAEYCFDWISKEDENVVVDIAVLECSCKNLYSTRQPYHEDWINQLFAAVAGLSGLFTTLNVIIYLLLRHYLNVSGWVEFAYFLSLGVFSFFSIPAFLYHTTTEDDYFCFATSGILHFSEIMSYSAYFMIAFDVYWMLRKSDSSASYGEEIEESKIRLVIYYLILFFVPIGLITYGILLNQESVIPSVCGTVPMYGRKSCFAPAWLLSEYIVFGTESATLVVILLSVNHIFGRLSTSTDVEDAPRVSLLSNMFFFTLSYWIIDLLKFSRTFLMGSNEDTSSKTDEPFWIALDGLTYAQGIMSFVVFIFNRKTLKAFRRKAGTDGTLRDTLAAVLAIE